MSGYTLGLSYGFHDATAALVRDGQLIAAAAEERFTRQKHDDAFPKRAAEYCLATAGITVQDLTKIAYHERPAQTFTRVIASSLAAFPRSRREFTGSMKAWLGRKLWVASDVSKRLGVDPALIAFHGHHESHAAQAFLGSGLDEAAILTIDAVGEWATTTLAHGTREGIKTLHTTEFPDSLGLVYSAFTAYLGFVPMDGECSVMALAAFGAPRYAGLIRKMDQSYFNFFQFYEAPWTDKLVRELGPPRAPHNKLPFDALCDEQVPVTAEDQRFADVAASVQFVFEERLLELARRLKRETGAKTLCFAGGAALNCVANAKLMRAEIFESIYVPPDPGDGGAAVGAALLADATKESHAAKRSGQYGPFLGPKCDASAEHAMLPHIDPKGLRRHMKIGYQQPKSERWDYRRITDKTALINEVAELLNAGQIVGWCQGSAESGPRALGARSLLIRADDVALARRLSRDVKDRAAYRPYALSMTRAVAAELLDTDTPDAPLYRWMQASCSIRPAQRTKVRAGLHADGTTRPQVVDPAAQPLYHQLLEAFGTLSGTACLINTSFNESGAPLVTTAFEALAVFARTGLDALVVDDLLVRKMP